MAIKYLAGDRIIGTSQELFNMYVPDSVGTSGNGVLNGNITLGTGADIKLGTASYDCDGTSDYVTVSPSGMVFGSTGFTFAGWMKTDSISTIAYFVKVATNVGTSHFYVSGSSSSYLRCEGTWGTVNASSGTWSNATWYHIALTNDGTTTKTYQNGSLVGSVTASSDLGTVSSFVIGADPTYYELNGKLDDMGVWSKALSASEISALYNGGTGKEIKTIPSLSVGCEAYYTFDSLTSGLVNQLGTATSTRNLPDGTIFEQSDTGKHMMFDGTSAWNEMS
jgi:hypothetical protein